MNLYFVTYKTSKYSNTQVEAIFANSAKQADKAIADKLSATHPAGFTVSVRTATQAETDWQRKLNLR